MRISTSRVRGALLGLPALLLPLACTSAPAETVEKAPPPHPVTTEEALADFETAWNAINDSYYDPDFLVELDWKGIHDELLPRAEAATHLGEVRAVIGEMLERLGQSHFALIPAEALPTATRDDDEEETSDDDAGGGDEAGSDDVAAGSEEEIPDDIAGGCGLDVRFRDDRLLITRVEEGSPAAAAGIRMGWVLKSVGSLAVDELVEDFAASREEYGERIVALQAREVFRARTYGEVGSVVEVVCLDENDREVPLELERTKRHAIAHSASESLPTFYLEFESETFEMDGKRLGRICFSNWFLPMAPLFDRAVDEMRGYDGIVIDLRGNGGGALAMCMGLAGHFFDEKKVLGTMKYPVSVMKYTANPRRISPDGKRVQPFAGPLAILVDETSGSASEVFSGGVQSVGRARVFGETSVGAVLPARMTILPSGDSLLHVMANFKTSDGTLLEGQGVIPDEVVLLEREDLLAGEDAQLQAALRWLASQ